MADRRPAPSRNPFVLPAGPAGRVAGWLMGRDDRPRQEAAELLAPRPGAAVCEIGFGPGQFLTVLAARDPDVRLSGADPSAVMLAQARRRLEAGHPRVAHRADLRLGVAQALPFADGSAEYVAAINNAAVWPRPARRTGPSPPGAGAGRHPACRLALPRGPQPGAAQAVRRLKAGTRFHGSRP